MNNHEFLSEIPDDLAASLRAAAYAAPPYPGDLAEVRRRRQARRRRRAVTATGLAATGVVAALGIPFAVGGAAGSGGEGTDQPAVASPAQRLLLRGDSWLVATDGAELPDRPVGAAELYRQYQGQPGVSGRLLPPSEVLPDGSVVELDLDPLGIDSVRQLVEMPDGRLALIGQVDRMPDIDTDDELCFEGIEFPLLVVEPDGSVSTSRDVREPCRTLTLVAADATTAYLVRDSRLVAHDLATGGEQILLDSVEALPADSAGVAYADGQIVTFVPGPNRSCEDGLALELPLQDTDDPAIRVTDVATGATVEHPMPQIDCLGSTELIRVSPDGSYAAVAYELGRMPGNHWVGVALVDVDSGKVVTEWSLTDTTTDRSVVAGLAWKGGRTVRVAYYQAPQDRLNWVPSLIRVKTFSVPGA